MGPGCVAELPNVWYMWRGTELPPHIACVLGMRNMCTPPHPHTTHRPTNLGCSIGVALVRVAPRLQNKVEHTRAPVVKLMVAAGASGAAHRV